MSIFLHKKVKIVKLKDNTFDNNHPRGINEGYERIGIVDKFEVGDGLLLSNNFFYSSDITSINEEKGIFQTKHSTYQIELILE